jgi:hypothetical protein
MTEPTRPSPSPSPSPLPDDLVARYHAAQAELDADPHHDKAIGPSVQVRANVLAYAAQLAAQPADGRSATGPQSDASAQSASALGNPNLIANYPIYTSEKGQKNLLKTAANDSQWKIRALASIAIFGLSGLLFMQWDRAPAEDQEVAFSNARPAPPAAKAVAPPPAASTADAAQAETSTPAAASPQTRSAQLAGAAAPTAAAPAATAPAPPANPVDKLATAKPPLTAKPAPVPTAASPALAEAATASGGLSSAIGKAETSERSADAAAAKAPAAEPAAPAFPSATPSATPSPAPSPAPMAARAKSISPPSTAQSDVKDSSPSFESPTDSSRANAKATGKFKSPTQPAPDSANAALFAAIRSKDTAALALALQNGADKNAKSNGTPALTLCVQAEQLGLVRQLLAAGADANALDAQGVSALAHARRRGLDDVAAALLAGGAR